MAILFKADLSRLISSKLLAATHGLLINRRLAKKDGQLCGVHGSPALWRIMGQARKDGSLVCLQLKNR
ncbi:hypothetical protein JHK87_011866 [Glycine soja]|nr:hypothetical protein JHK87_011866 [Glycine soja]